MFARDCRRVGVQLMFFAAGNTAETRTEEQIIRQKFTVHKKTKTKSWLQKIEAHLEVMGDYSIY